MFPAFNAQSLKARLMRLNGKQQLAFGAICCERLLPNYQAFQKDTGWGDITPIREALNFVWESIVNESVDKEQTKILISRCELVAPDSEDFESLFVTSAQDACFAVCSLLDFLLKNNTDKIVQVATYATDSVDLYVQEIEEMESTSPSLETNILNHHLMQRELEQQELNLNEIDKCSETGFDLLESLRLSWDNDGKSNLDLP